MDYSKLTDEAVVKKIVQDGRVEAFGVLYDRYSQKVYNKCLTFVKSPSKAEDLTHDIFLKAFVNLSTFKCKSKFSTWFYSLAYHQCIDYVRMNASKNKVDYMDLEELEEKRVRVFHNDTEQRLLTIEVAELKKVLEMLKPEDRMILLMKYQDEMSIKDIQQGLKLTESAVKMRLLRARERAIAIYDKLFLNYKSYGQ